MIDEKISNEIRKTILYFHGGGYYLCSKESHRNIASVLAKKANARVLGNSKPWKNEIFNQSLIYYLIKIFFCSN
jgi:hypothetical protein